MNIGFLNFVEKPESQPVSLLKQALSERRALDKQNGTDLLNGSLIVLPEAFNIGTVYESGRPHNCDPGITVDLKQLAFKFGVAFVSGLVIRTSRGRKPYNSAYLLTSDLCRTLSRKVCSDHMAQDLYQVCTHGCDKPRKHNGTCVASLICIDAELDPHPAQTHRAEHEDNHIRHRGLWDKISSLGQPTVVLCVPARAKSIDEIEERWKRFWKGKGVHLVVSNSYPDGDSMIAMTGVEPQRIRNTASAGKIELAELPNA